MSKLDELEALAKAATPGPWRNSEERPLLCVTVGIPADSPRWNGRNDAAFIAAANPATVLDLIELIRAMGPYVNAMIATASYVKPAISDRLDAALAKLEDSKQ